MPSGRRGRVLFQSEINPAARLKTWDNYWASKNDSSQENRSGSRLRRGALGCSSSSMHSRFILMSACNVGVRHGRLLVAEPEGDLARLSAADRQVLTEAARNVKMLPAVVIEPELMPQEAPARTSPSVAVRPRVDPP